MSALTDFWRGILVVLGLVLVIALIPLVAEIRCKFFPWKPVCLFLEDDALNRED